MKGERIWRLFLLYGGLSLTLFLLDKKSQLGAIHRVIKPPILLAEERLYQLSFSFNQWLRILRPTAEKDQEIFQLRGELARLAVDQNQLSECQGENEHLKKLLGAPLPPKWKFLEAKVISVTDKMRLNRGKRDGVKEGMMVISQNILVGKVVSVGETDSSVQLTTDPASRIPVAVKRPLTAGSTTQISKLTGLQARGLLLGQMDRRLLLDRILQNEDIQKGDLVLTSGEETWPVGLVIGKVEEVLPPSAEVYKRATVLPLIDYSSLPIVFFIIP